jgi:DNA-binding transcriptional ArsR family regulator
VTRETNFSGFSSRSEYNRDCSTIALFQEHLRGTGLTSGGVPQKKVSRIALVQTRSYTTLEYIAEAEPEGTGGGNQNTGCHNIMTLGGKKMKGEAPTMSSKEMAQIRQNLEGTPDIEEAAELMNLAGNSTRLKLLYLLDNMKELCVCDLAEMLGVSVSAVSQHLAKLKAYGLVAPRRDAQTIYYRLTEHIFNAKLRENFFKQFQV